ncbi:MAG: phytoene desaturase family protein, partial [Chloroflexota bacterium]
MNSGKVSTDPDVIIIGGGPNGLTAAALLLQAGLSVLVLETNTSIGGAVRSAEICRTGFIHDLFSGFYPLFPVGPIGQLPLDRYGLRWKNFQVPFAGGTPNGTGVSVHRHAEDSISSFERAGSGDGEGYRQLWSLWQDGGQAVLDLLFHPIGSPAALGSAKDLGSLSRALEMAQVSVASAENVAGRFFKGEDARVWYIESPLHSDLGPGDAGGGLYGLVMMGLGQQVGMPVPEGGAQSISDALGRMIRSLGGDIRTGERVDQVIVRQGRAEGVRANGVEFRARRAVLATIPPTTLFGALIKIDALPASFVRAVKRFRWGSGVFKLDLALSG